MCKQGRGTEGEEGGEREGGGDGGREGGGREGILSRLHTQSGANMGLNPRP